MFDSSTIQDTSALLPPHLSFKKQSGFKVHGKDGNVIFPSYMKIFNIQQIPPISVPFQAEELQILVHFVERLSLSARTDLGHNEQIVNFSDKTICVNPLVKLSQKPSLVTSTQNLVKLYEAATYLNLKPLINLFAFYIVDRIYPLTTSLDVALQSIGLKENNEHLKKNLLLRENHVTELTISDYIGLFGQPEIINSQLNLTSEGLTSLQGLQLIFGPEEIEELILDHNFFIFDDPISIAEYLRPFNKLKKISLSGNRPSAIPLNLFANIGNVKIIL